MIDIDNYIDKIFDTKQIEDKFFEFIEFVSKRFYRRILLFWTIPIFPILLITFFYFQMLLIPFICLINLFIWIIKGNKNE